MRHVKLRPSDELNTMALLELIQMAYKDMKSRVESVENG